MNANEMNEYEAPEVFELGQAEELTDGRPLGDWPEGPPLYKWTFAP